MWLRCFEADGGGWIPRILGRGRTDGRGVGELRLPWLAELARRTAPPADGPGAGEIFSLLAEDDQEIRRYVQRLRAAHRDLPVAGFETRVRLPIRLDEVYVPLRARIYREVLDRDHKEFGTCRELIAESDEDRDVPFDAALRLAAEKELRGAVVLGDPGSGKTTYPAGASPYGTLDQAGNVWEWCVDVWDENAYEDRHGQVDPVGTGKSAWRVLRGGSWWLPATHLAAAYRYGDRATTRVRDIGFRCLLPMAPEQ